MIHFSTSVHRIQVLSSITLNAAICMSHIDLHFVKRTANEWKHDCLGVSNDLNLTRKRDQQNTFGTSTFVFTLDNTVTSKLFILQQWVPWSHERTGKRQMVADADLPRFWASSSPTVRIRARPLLTRQLRCHAHLPWPAFEGHDCKQRQHGVTNIVEIEIASFPFPLFLL